MSNTTTVLITGANRGVGRGLTELFLSRPNHTVIAAVRNPSSTTLESVPKAQGTKIIIVKIESTSDMDPAEAITKIQSAGVDHLDIVIANAAISGSFALVESTKLNEIRDMFEVNTLGPLKLLEATFPLLKATADKKGAGAPKFVAVTSNAASIQDVDKNVPYLIGAYGSTKAALNYLVKRAQAEHDWLTAFVVNPGFVATDMGNVGVEYFKLDGYTISVQQSAEGIVKIVDQSTRETASGRFFDYDGSELRY